jgi:hypothetical protein
VGPRQNGFGPLGGTRGLIAARLVPELEQEVDDTLQVILEAASARREDRHRALGDGVLFGRGGAAAAGDYGVRDPGRSAGHAT